MRTSIEVASLVFKVFGDKLGGGGLVGLDERSFLGFFHFAITVGEGTGFLVALIHVEVILRVLLALEIAFSKGYIYVLN